MSATIIISAVIAACVWVACMAGAVVWLIRSDARSDDSEGLAESYAARRGMEAAITRGQIRRDGARFRRQLLREMEEMS